YPTAPTSFAYFGNQDQVFNFNVPSLTGSVLVSITVPAGTTDSAAELSVKPLTTPAEVSQGIIDLDITMRLLANNQSITDLNKVMEIRYWTPFIGGAPSLIESGLRVNTLTRLQSPGLVAGLQNGYYVNSDGTYSIFTRSLSSFIFAQPQSKLLLTHFTKSIYVGQSTKLRIKGGSGIGEVSFRSINSGICSVSSIGTVTGLSSGDCLIQVAKEGTIRFLSALSNTLMISVKDSNVSALNSNSNRNWLIYKAYTDKYSVIVNLPAGYANNKVDLQLRNYIRGKLIYQTLATLTLDERGDALFEAPNSLLKGSRLRLQLDGSNIKYGTTI
ncbi:MAG: hypothetical protein RJB54_148, partial [Actinomycetota bacterium]